MPVTDAAVETLEFDALCHTYTLRPSGRVLPSVTGIMRAAGLTDYSMVKPDVLEAKRALGEAVHKATHYLDDGDLDWSSVAPEVEPYVRAWELAQRETGFVPVLLETAVHHPAYHYAGTFDRLGFKDGFQNDNDGKPVMGRWIVLGDLKTGDPEAACAGLQTAAYLEAVPEEMWRRVLAAAVFADYAELPVHGFLRWSFELRADGTYRLHEYRDYRDFRVFLGALQVVNYKAGRKPR